MIQVEEPQDHQVGQKLFLKRSQPYKMKVPGNVGG